MLGFGLGLVLLAGLVLGPNEGASVWCWGTSTAVAVMVLEPQVVHWAEPRGEAVRHLPALTLTLPLPLTLTLTQTQTLTLTLTLTLTNPN